MSKLKLTQWLEVKDKARENISFQKKPLKACKILRMIIFSG